MRYLLLLIFLSGCTAQDYCDPNITRSDMGYCNCHPKNCQPSDYEPIDWENM